ncbi:DUF1257 domain-containing protein [Acaryochloris marina]|uniref:DUF1257 domain-containing protein n=1 Tax=Acaryochloris marina (strain MBIC 11017) TaxID=329726 RepID=B0CC76_ACAM1|nr:DUF1257 domain-containing protein [Acaryochloris marina]ABW26761.1 conserved hypothetical protein [Acaryochloris marina MBIC11017]BDM81538.1 hypothetical protein AM10699_44050 [Acaryochloris marina MBIC10699]
MSHFSQIKTQIRNLPALQSALNDLGLDWKAGPQPIRGYKGKTQSAELVIEQDNGYDIGFSKSDEAYELVADMDFWQQAWSVDRFLEQVTQRYAYHTVINTTAQQGFQVAEQVNNEDGSIRLVVQRWNA